MPDQAKCRSCGQPVRWVQSTLGNWMPLDAQPVAGGNIVLLPDGTAQTLRGDLFETVPPDQPRYQSHFASCANAEHHRKPKKGS